MSGRPSLCLAVLLLSPVALAGAEIRILDGNGSNEGLNDQTPATPLGGNPGTTVGEQRLIAAQYAASLWSAMLGNRVPISVQVEFTDLDCSGGTAVLGAAGPSLLYDDNRYPAALANERAGQDLDATREEIDARLNSRLGQPDCAVTTWYPGLDNAAPTGTTDLSSVLLHEFAHGLGFIKSATAFRDQAQDDGTGLLLSQLSANAYDSAVRQPLGVSWVGPAVRALKDSILDKSDGVMRLTSGAAYPLARAHFGPAHVVVTAPVVLARDADGGLAHDACNPLAPSPGALVLAERNLHPDGGLICFVSQRALYAQAAGAVGLVVRHGVPGSGPTAYTGDAGPDLAIPVWGIGYDDGAALEQYIAGDPAPVLVDGDGRRAGENLAGDVLLYTPAVYSEGSSVGHWDSSASPSLLMEPVINPDLPRNLDLTPAALEDVGWSPPKSLTIGATTLGANFTPGRAPRFIVQVINRGPVTVTGVVLDARDDATLALDSTALDCTGTLPCALGDLQPGAMKTVIASTRFIRGTPSQASVTFTVSGSPAPSRLDASTTVIATRATSGCSSTGGGPGGGLALLAVAGWLVRRRRSAARALPGLDSGGPSGP